MANRMRIVFGYLVLVAALLQFAIGKSSGSTTHTVGEDMGWTIPSSSDYYSTWASSKKFVVGDTLLFNFPGVHTVAEVSKAAYDACNTKSIPIGGSILSTSPSTIRLNTAGAHFYICTVGEHCMFGQKLFINVNGINRTTTSTPPTTAATPSATVTPPSTTVTPPPPTTATPPSTTVDVPSSATTTPPSSSTIATPPSTTTFVVPSFTTTPPSENPTIPPSTHTTISSSSFSPTEGPTSRHENSASSSSSLTGATLLFTLLSMATLAFFL